MTLVDILGAEGATADPGHLASVASQFESVARDSDHARHLLSTGSPIQWVGQASDLFEQHLSQLPEQLSKVSLSIGHAAGALWTYSHTLEEILPQARNLSTQLEQIRRELAVNRRMLSTATDPTQVKHLNQRIADLTWDERTTRNKARALRTWLSDAAAVCVDQLRQAGEAGMQNSWTATVAEIWHSSVWVAGYVFDHVIKAVDVFVKVVVEPFETLNTTVLKFVAEPSWTTAAPMFRAAAAVTGEVAFIAAIVGLCLTGVGAPAAGLLISTAGGLAGHVALGAGALTVASDVGMIATGKKVSALEVGSDVVGVVLSGGSTVGKSLAKKELAKAAKRGAGKQTASQIARGTKAQRVMAQTIQARIAGYELGPGDRVKELQVLGKLNVFPKHPLALNHYPLAVHVNRYLELDKVLVSSNFRALTIANHVIEGADFVKDAVDGIAAFDTLYGQTDTSTSQAASSSPTSPSSGGGSSW